jgi:small-conductance mechanosensitive channel
MRIRQVTTWLSRRHVIVVLGVVFLLLIAGFGSARKVETVGEDTESGVALIQEAQEILKSENSSIVTLRRTRERLASLREASTAIVEAGSVEGLTIRAQLETMAPPPGESLSESEGLASRRAALREALNEAEEPIRAAKEVLQQSEVLIREFDRRIREQQTSVLLHRLPSPVVPTAWLTAGADLALYGGTIIQQLKSTLDEPDEIARLKGNIPTILVLGGFGLVVLLVGQPMLLRRLEFASTTGRARWFRWLVVALRNFSRLALPAIGTASLLLIVKLIQVNAHPFIAITQVLPVVASIVVIAFWLGHTIFSPTSREERLLTLADERARLGFRLCLGLGVVLALKLLIETVLQNHLFAEATIAVLATPLTLCSCLLLWQMGRLLQAGEDEKDDSRARITDDDQRTTHVAGFLNLLSRVMQGAALVIPFFLLLGFVKLSQEAVDSIVLTVMLLGLALLLYKFAVNVLEAILEAGQAGERKPLSLLPVCVICLLFIIFTPLLALAWGASIADLREVWRLLTNGVQLGEIRLSLDVVLTLVIVFTIGVFFTRWLQRLLRVSVLPRTRLDRGAQTALVTGVGYFGLTLTGLLAVSAAGLNLSNLAVVAGALSVGIGFGLQTIVSNFVSGIILLVERPIKEGDWIEVSGYSGVVRKISVRSTRIETFDRHDVVLPNSDLISGTVKNMTLSSQTGRLIIPVGVAYGSDLEKTRGILLDAAKSHKSVETTSPVTVLFVGLGESSLDFELRCFLRNIDEILSVKSDLLFAIYAGLKREGIEIPFPQRDINIPEIDRLIAAIEQRNQTAVQQSSAD